MPAGNVYFAKRKHRAPKASPLDAPAVVYGTYLPVFPTHPQTGVDYISYRGGFIAVLDSAFKTAARRWWSFLVKARGNHGPGLVTR